MKGEFIVNKKFLSFCIVISIVCLTIVPSFAAVSNSTKHITENDGGGFEVVLENDGNTRATKSKTIYDGNTRAGYWIYGNRSGTLVSEMKGYEPYEGRASVTNGVGDYEDGGWQPPNHWSKASLTWTFSGTNKANYDYRIS